MAKRVRIDVDVDSKKGVQSISNVNNSVKKLENQSSKSAKKISSDFDRIKKGLIGIGVGIAAAKIVQNVSQMSKEIIDYGDQLQKLNLKLGVSVNEMDKLRKIAELSGVEFKALATSLQRQTRRLQEAAKGGGTAADALKTLGLNAKEISKLAPEEQFKIIAREMNKVENQGKKVAIAFKLWDTEGVKVLQMIEGLDEQLKNTTSEMDQNTVESFAKFNDNITKMKDNIKDALIPNLERLANTFNKVYEAANGGLLKEPLKGQAAVEAFEKFPIIRNDDRTLAEKRQYNAMREAYAEMRYEELKAQEESKKTSDKTSDALENLNNKTKIVTDSNREYAETLKKLKLEYQNLDAINLTDKEQRMMVNEDDYNKAKSLMDKWNQDKKDQIALTKEMNDFINENTLSSYELERQELERNYQKFSEVQGNKIALLQAYGIALKDINDREAEATDKKLAENAEKAKTTFQKWQESAQTTSDLITEVVLKASDAIASGMTNALYDFIDGTKSAQDAFKDFARDFLSQITKMIIQQQILNALKTSSGFFGGMLGFADGGTVPGGFKAFASGGTVTKPTLGLVGEGSMNEAIVPLPDGKSIPVDLKNNNNKAPNVKIEVINNGNNVEATQTTPKFDGQQWVIGVVLDAINNNVGFKNQIKGAVTS